MPRSLDVSWTYEGEIPISVSGFNPFESAFYYGDSSRFAAWLTDPLGSAREFNENDLLLKEVLFMVHDYLHAWAYSVIDEIAPSRRVLHGPITADTLEDYVFCHLVTETAATVGLDYWCLAQRDLNELCPIGTNIKTLTVEYYDALLPEYRRFCPELDVQTPEFFRALAVFYCTGDFPGFDADDLRRSPQLLRWLRHELAYGVTQRSLVRGWLAYMADAPLAVAEPDLNAPIDLDLEGRMQLIDEVGHRLWAKVKNPSAASASAIRPSAVPTTRRARPDKQPDFRFVNVARVPPDRWESLQPATGDNFKYFFYQFLTQFPLASVPARKRKHLPHVYRHGDVELLLDLLDGQPRREAFPDEPRDLLVVA
ncbi:MAG TPA: hypothetical protein VHW23_19710 [Kofleriaceae bacterium]|nr:hypothetical protein [Kofleriaceae bacterium]